MNAAVNLIVRNEEHRLPTLLPYLKEYFEEIIVVDQESIDRTVEVCHDLDVDVISDKPTGYADSSRQLALDNTKADWVFTVDADEIPVIHFLNELEYNIQEPNIDGYYHHMGFFLVEDYSFLQPGILIDLKYQTFDDNPNFQYHNYSSSPNHCRLCKKEALQINPKVHGGIGPKDGSNLKIRHQCCVLQVKTVAEQDRDAQRYTAVDCGYYDPDKYL